jgi:serine/threonine-protein kinase HipA
MNRCPITYEAVPKAGDFSPAGLRRLHPQLQRLAPLPFDSAALIQEAAARAPKMSIQGVQPKLSAVLRIKEGRMEIVDQGGRFILKPQNPQYPHLPENEALTMTLAQIAGLAVPDHGMLYAKDGRLVYWIRRFDRVDRDQRVAVEDFAQLSGASRESKYGASVEDVIKIIKLRCTFPSIELADFYRRFLVNWLLGNEDMHLKNYSVITMADVIKLAPCYDFLNTTIHLSPPQEESALALNGKKRKLSSSDLTDYLTRQRLGLNDRTVARIMADLRAALPQWRDLIKHSFLPEKLRDKYHDLMEHRSAALFGK